MINLSEQDISLIVNELGGVSSDRLSKTINEIKDGMRVGRVLEIPASSIVFTSLFFWIFTKNNIPENKKINIESSIMVVGVFASVRTVAIQIIFSNFLSFK